MFRFAVGARRHRANITGPNPPKSQTVARGEKQMGGLNIAGEADFNAFKL
jgi:hypothetical protein